ncbi:molybdopterin-guanine dinucleotide biosynthesis protein MobC [Phytobacter diazotrophicus]|nr:molybdopterin-guanine dinucleotide biosynthesis protein MobC [Phytobacter diazotrophicus]
MTEKKWFTSEDVELAKTALAELPDLTEKRLTKSDVLEKLKDQIIILSGRKGYSIEDIRSALQSVGIQTSVKAIREILNNQKKSQAGTVSSRRRTTKNTRSNPEAEEK